MNLKELADANKLSERADALMYESLDFKAALPLAQEALKIRERILGDLHPLTITSIKDVGALLLDVGRAEEALPVILREVTSIEGVYGKDSKEYTYGMSLLSRCYEALGNYQEAIKCLWLKIAIENREEDVGNANLTKICIARCLHKLGRSDEAILLLEDARATLRDPELSHFKGELKAFLELAVIERDLNRMKGLGDLFERLTKAVEQFNYWKELTAPRQLNKIAKIYEEAGLKEIALEIQEVSDALAQKYQ